MTKTLTTCSWLIAGLGTVVTLLYYPDGSGWLPLALLPYGWLVLAARSARRLATRAAVLVLTLSSVCLGFWIFWDARIRPSTLNLYPLAVVITESLVAGVTWLVVRRIERPAIDTTQPGRH